MWTRLRRIPAVFLKPGFRLMARVRPAALLAPVPELAAAQRRALADVVIGAVGAAVRKGRVDETCDLFDVLLALQPLEAAQARRLTVFAHELTHRLNDALRYGRVREPMRTLLRSAVHEAAAGLLRMNDLPARYVRACWQIVDNSPAGRTSRLDAVQWAIQHPNADEELFVSLAENPLNPRTHVMLAQRREARQSRETSLAIIRAGLPEALAEYGADWDGNSLEQLIVALDDSPSALVRAIELAGVRLGTIPQSRLIELLNHNEDTVRLVAITALRDMNLKANTSSSAPTN